MPRRSTDINEYREEDRGDVGSGSTASRWWVFPGFVRYAHSSLAMPAAGPLPVSRGHARIAANLWRLVMVVASPGWSLNASLYAAAACSYFPFR